MSFAAFDGTRRVPVAANEPVRTYAPNSPETKNLKLRLDRMAAEQVEIPIVIGGRRIHTGNTGTVTMPCDHHHVLATYHKATPELVHEAIAASAAAYAEWSSWRWEDRAAVFLRAAELLTAAAAAA
jgi:1-pyrroline-5-carboxylate dehydrogenase